MAITIPKGLDPVHLASWLEKHKGEIAQLGGADAEAFKSSMRPYNNQNNFGESIFDPGAEDRRNAQDKQDDAVSQWQGVEAPNAEQLKIDPFSLAQYGHADNKLDLSGAESALWDPSKSGLSSAYDRINYSGPETTGRDATTSAIGQYKQLLASGGHDAVSDANMARQLGSAEMHARAMREAAVENAKERGAYTGGAGLQAELSAASDMSREGHTAALESAALAQARRDSATQSMGNLGTNLQTTDQNAANSRNDFNNKQAAGQDAWSKTYGDWAQTAGEEKADLRGQSATQNWNRTNQNNDQNVTGYNDVMTHNANIPQQMFNNQVTLTGGQTGQLNNASNVDLDAGKQTKGIAAGVGGIVENAATAYQKFRNGGK
jgi:hypothetical protein